MGVIVKLIRLRRGIRNFALVLLGVCSFMLYSQLKMASGGGSKMGHGNREVMLRNETFSVNIKWTPKHVVEDGDDVMSISSMDDANLFPSYVAESPPDGKGEYGRPVVISKMQLSLEDTRKYEEGYKLNSFNQFASDVMSVSRRLPDPRSPECQAITHQSRLQASVILCFHDEAWSTLLRSIHSIINRSPPHLLKEVILVDDASDLDHLGVPLERYLERLGGLVRIVRTGNREGLIRARLLGFRHATAEVVVFLDSHIECFPGWLEPLLDRIAENPRAVPYPTIDSIHSDTLAVKPRYPRHVGTFYWSNLVFKWMPLEKLHGGRPTSPAEPIRSATMPGGLFAISRKWFSELGTYDDGLDYWGGENLELSFKVWMCNGSVEVLPCSHVGHIYRHNNPIKWSSPGTTRHNAARVAEVWMDEYKKFFYETVGEQKVEVGNMSHRHDLRKRLKCHDFDWYLKTVHPELQIPTDCQTVGEIRNAASQKCIDAIGKRSLHPDVHSCSGHGSYQFWCFRTNGEIWNYYHKLNVRHGRVKLSTTNGSTWIWTKEGFLQDTAGGDCLEADGNLLTLRKCSGEQTQIWQLTQRASSSNHSPT